MAMAEQQDFLKVEGRVHVKVEDEHGNIIHEQTVPNTITQIGKRYLTQRAANIASPEGQATGMKLGNDSATAASATGAGAALVSYEAGSHKAFDGGYPQEAAQGNGSRLTWQAQWGAGVATDTDLEEVVIVNDTLADATSAAADTLARAIIATVNKGASDTLTVNWQWDIGV